MPNEELNQPEFLTIESEIALQKLLETQNIDTTNWKKTVGQLYKETQEGETAFSLEGGELIRHTNAVFVEIVSPNGKQQLAEIRQVYHDGVRPDNIRNSPMIGEKLTNDEDPETGAIRGFCEELFSGKNIDTNKLIANEISSKLPTKRDTYPGLTTRADVTCFALQMPEEYYNPDGYQEVQEEKGKTNVFEWVPRYVIKKNDLGICNVLDEIKANYTLSNIPGTSDQYSIAIADPQATIIYRGAFNEAFVEFTDYFREKYNLEVRS